MVIYSSLDEDASREVSLQYFNECDLANRVGHMCICVAAPPWHSDQLSVVWPAGMTAYVCVSRLLPDTAICLVRSGRQGFDRLCTCVAAPP